MNFPRNTNTIKFMNIVLELHLVSEITEDFKYQQIYYNVQKTLQINNSTALLG